MLLYVNERLIAFYRVQKDSKFACEIKVEFFIKYIFSLLLFFKDPYKGLLLGLMGRSLIT